MNNKIVVFTRYESKRKAKFKDYAGYTMLNIGVTLRVWISLRKFRETRNKTGYDCA